MNNSSFFAGRGELINSFDFFKMGSTSKFNSALQRYNLCVIIAVNISGLSLPIFPTLVMAFKVVTYNVLKKKCNMES